MMEYRYITKESLLSIWAEFENTKYIVSHDSTMNVTKHVEIHSATGLSIGRVDGQQLCAIFQNFQNG